MTDDAPAYGLWGLVIINSLIFIIFAFSFSRPRHRRLDPRWKSVLGVPSHCDDAGRACNADRRRDLHLVSLRLNRLTIGPFHGWTLSIGPLL